jgi:hypothetical protein
MSTTKAQELREQAKQARQDSLDSFERCDTDGFLSQWASDCSARLLSAEADLAEYDYIWRFTTLGDAEGNLIPNKKIETKFGYAYAIFQSFADLEVRGAQIIQWVGTGEKAIAKKGYTPILVEAKGKAILGKGINPSAFIVPAVPFFTPENSTIVK